MKPLAPQRRSLLRDLFFGIMATAILVDQVVIAAHAQPILIFLVLFLYGSIPALRADAKPGYSLFARFFMAMLGVELPDSREDDSGSSATPTSSVTGGSSSSSQESSSSSSDE